MQQICSCNAGVFFWQAKVPWGLANISSFALHCMQHKVVLLVVLMVIRRRFLISSTQFLSIMFWVKTPFQIGDNIRAFFHFLCHLSLMCYHSIWKLNLTSIVWSRLPSNVLTKLMSSVAYLLKLGENLLYYFEEINIF